MVEFVLLFYDGSRDDIKRRYHGSGRDYYGDTQDATVAAREAFEWQHWRLYHRGRESRETPEKLYRGGMRDSIMAAGKCPS